MRKSGRGYRVRLQAPHGQARYGRGEAGLEKLIPTRSLLHALLPEPEVVGLVVLMLLHESRGVARTTTARDPTRRPVPFTLEQGYQVTRAPRASRRGERPLPSPCWP
jgi:hypothetical protein